MSEQPAGSAPRFDPHERLHVDVGPFCNNNCLFCMEEDRQGRQERVGQVTPEQVRTILEANRFRSHVTFVSGEPTLAPNFLTYVAMARDCGYQTIAVISNGRRFSHLAFARRALTAGLNRVIISIHGGHAQLHDGLVRTPGAFAQAVAGLDNLLALLQPGKPLTLHSSTVINRRNCSPTELERLVDLLLPRVEQMVFNVMQPFGRGLAHFDRLMMRYTEVAEAAEALFAARGQELPLYLVDIPYCTTEGRAIPGRARGFVERYVRFEPAPAPGTADSPLWANARTSSGGSPLRRQLQEEDPLSAPDSLAARRRDSQEQAHKERRPECDFCRHSHYCDGVWRSYLAHFGWEEFRPVALLPAVK